MLAATIREGEEKLAARRQAAAVSRAQLARALLALQRAQGRQVGERLDWAITQQRDVEEAALRLTKGVNSLYQRAAKWKAEQRRFRVHLEGLDNFADWAAAAETDLRAIAGNLEYVCAVLDKEHEATAPPSSGQQQ